MRTQRFAVLAVLLLAGVSLGQAKKPASSSSTGITLASGIGASPAAAGATLSSGTLTLQPADATHPGLVTTGTQTIAGAKTLSGGVTLGSAGITFNDATTQTTAAAAPTIATFGSSPTANGATVSGSAITLQPADATHPGSVTTGAQSIAGAKTWSGNAFFSGNISSTNGFGNSSGASGATQGLQFSGSNTYIVAAGSSFNAGFIANNGAHFLITTPSGISELGNSGPSITMGAGSPASVVTAVVGSLYLRTDGGASTTLYVKESGSGNTGWVAK